MCHANKRSPMFLHMIPSFHWSLCLRWRFLHPIINYIWILHQYSNRINVLAYKQRQESLANANVARDDSLARQKRILTWNWHSRSFILQSTTGRQGVAYRHVILLVLSRAFPKKQPHKPPKFAVVDNPTVIWRPAQGNPREYPGKPYISRN